MRILANENFPLAAVQALRNQGHDVVWIREDAPGSTDDVVIRMAENDQRLLITFDKDFGELAFRFGLSSEAGIILFRVPPSSAEYIARVAILALRLREDWAGHFSVVEEDRIRMTPLVKGKM